MERRSLNKLVVFIIILLSSDILAQIPQRNDSLWINVISDECIYDNNNHSAFTSLEEWKGHHYLAFREASAHRATPTDKGNIKLLKKVNNEWSPQHTFSMKGRDLRDPDILKWGDRLFLYSDGKYSELTTEGWTELRPIKHDAPFTPSIWKKHIHNNVAYGIGNRGGQWPLLMKSGDGVNWETVCEYKLGGNATEADIVFIADTMYICIRIDTPIGSNSLWGKSAYPYKECQWSVMDVSIASPEMIPYSDDIILLAGREYNYHQLSKEKNIYVSLLAIDKNGKLIQRYIVNDQISDQGYPSIIKGKSDMYYMSYYVGDSKKTKIRMMTLKITNRELKK